MIFFLFLHENIIMLWVIIRSAWRGTCDENHNICFYGEVRKISILFHRKKHLIWSYELQKIKNN